MDSDIIDNDMLYVSDIDSFIYNYLAFTKESRTVSINNYRAGKSITP
jgi:hypothetical protein